MSILDNEGHDPQGFGNQPSWAEVHRLHAEIERLTAERDRLSRCHRIVAKQISFYKPDLPNFTKVEIPIGVLRAAEQCVENPPWESLDNQQRVEQSK